MDASHKIQGGIHSNDSVQKTGYIGLFHTLALRAAHVTLADFFKSEPNPFTGQDWLFQFFCWGVPAPNPAKSACDKLKFISLHIFYNCI